MTSLRAVASLIAAIVILQAAQGLLGVQLPLAMHADGLKGAAIGFVGAMYSAGFMAGAWFGPTMLARVGHIRVFAASASVVSASTLMMFAASDPISWGVLRAIMGGAIALVFVAVDSWMSAAVSREERGGAMGIYQLLTKVALMVGPFLVFGMPMDGPVPLMIAGALQAIAVVPIALSTQAQPQPPSAQPLAVREQFDVAPAAVTAAFFSGFINAGVMTLAPLYAEAFYGQAQAPAFMAAAWFGSIILQYPAGRLSDRMDRRTVIAGLAALATVSAIALAVAGPRLPFWVAAVLFGLWGAGGLSFYGIATAHMADRAEPGRMAQAASGLLFVWATGSIVGPLLLGVAVEAGGRPAMFWFAGVCAAALTAFMLHRRGARDASTSKSASEAVAPPLATSVAASEMAYGDEEPRLL
jgi:MFS family permease